MSHGSYAGKVLVVTGGASGIGLATAELAAQRGAHVVISDIHEHAPEAVARLEQASDEGKPCYVPADVTDEQGVARLVETVLARYGRLDAAFNNAGVGGYKGPLHTCPMDDFKKVVDVNLAGVFRCMKYQIPQMLAQGRGSIINMASIAGLTGFPVNQAYAAAKAGVMALTRSAAAELALSHQDILVNAVCPGWVNTPLLGPILSDPESAAKLLGSVPRAELGKPIEIAKVVCFLAFEAPPYLTGESVRVDGALLASSPSHVALMGKQRPAQGED